MFTFDCSCLLFAAGSLAAATASKQDKVSNNITTKRDEMRKDRQGSPSSSWSPNLSLPGHPIKGTRLPMSLFIFLSLSPCIGSSTAAISRHPAVTTCRWPSVLLPSTWPEPQCRGGASKAAFDATGAYILLIVAWYFDICNYIR